MTKQGGRFTKGPLDLPLPAWAGAAAVVLAFIYGGIWLYGEWGDIVDEQLEESVIAASLRRLDRYEILARAQLAESNRHMFESEVKLDAPSIDGYFQIQFEDGQRLVRYHTADKCISVLHRDADRESPQFVYHPDRIEEIMLENRKELLEAELTLGGLAPLWATEAPPSCDRDDPDPGPGCCEDPHPPPWTAALEQLDDCRYRIDRVFEDTCEHYVVANYCEKTYEPHVWTRCIH